MSFFLRHRDSRFQLNLEKRIEGPDRIQSYGSSLQLELLYPKMNAQITPLHIQGRVGQILESTMDSVISTGIHAWNACIMVNKTSDAQLYPVLSL